MRNNWLVVLVAGVAVACGGTKSSRDGAGSLNAGSGGEGVGEHGGSGGSAGAFTGGGSAGQVSAGGGGVDQGGANGGMGGAALAGATGSAGSGGGSSFLTQLLLNRGCLPNALPVDTLFGTIPCTIVEANALHACDCAQASRATVDPSLVARVRVQLLASGNCGSNGQPNCDSFCMCEIVQESGRGGTECKMDPAVAAADPVVTPGFCYADDPASPALANCPANQKQSILFVSTSDEPTPSPGALVFLACQLADERPPPPPK